MEENVKIDISTRPKQPILNLAKTLDTYMKTRIKIENPNPTQYDTMYDFIQRTKSGILGI